MESVTKIDKVPNGISQVYSEIIKLKREIEALKIDNEVCESIDVVRGELGVEVEVGSGIAVKSKEFVRRIAEFYLRFLDNEVEINEALLEEINLTPEELYYRIVQAFKAIGRAAEAFSLKKKPIYQSTKKPNLPEYDEIDINDEDEALAKLEAVINLQKQGISINHNSLKVVAAKLDALRDKSRESEELVGVEVLRIGREVQFYLKNTSQKRIIPILAEINFESLNKAEKDHILSCVTDPTCYSLGIETTLETWEYLITNLSYNEHDKRFQAVRIIAYAYAAKHDRMYFSAAMEPGLKSRQIVAMVGSQIYLVFEDFRYAILDANGLIDRCGL